MLQIINLTPGSPLGCIVSTTSYIPTSLPGFVRLFAFPVPFQIVGELGDCLGNCIEDVPGVVRSSLTAP